MGVRVNIQYSVDIEDLGAEVGRLIGDAFINLNNVVDQIPGHGFSQPDVLSLKTIQTIDEIRQKLANIDIRLSDAVNLINGYVSYKSDVISKQQIAEEADQASQPQSEIGDNISDIRMRLQELASENAD